nr:hypothetical protein [Tanacetum cinerariifolium]GEW73739.1 hypothetical protein [Tanacetum cinerariifolium]
MDSPNVTTEEYIRLEEEKYRRRDKVYNWKLLRLHSRASLRVFYKVVDIVTCLVKVYKVWDDWEVNRYRNANLGYRGVVVVIVAVVEWWFSSSSSNRRSRNGSVVHEMFNEGVEMVSLYMRCSTKASRCIVVHEMFNGGVEMVSLYIRCSTDESICGVEMVSLYMRCSTDESRWYRCTRDAQRRSRDNIVVHEMFNG